MKKIQDKELKIKISNQMVIVFMSDDLRTARYGNAEILFFKKYSNEFGSWRVIKRNGQYLAFKYLSQILLTEKQYYCITDSRFR